MSFSRQSFTIDPDISYRYSDRDAQALYGGVLLKGNGTTNFGKLRRGTVLSRLTTGLRPAAYSALTDAVAAAVLLEVADDRNFFVGDVVDVLSGTTPGATIVAGADTTDIVIVPKVPGLSLNIVVSGTSTELSHSYVQATGVIEVVGATSGADASLTTLAQLAAILESTYGSLIESATPADGTKVLVDVGPTALGTVIGAVAASARTVTAINRTTKVLTLSGGNLTLAIGDIVRLATGWQPAGILDRAERTVHHVDGEAIETDVSCKYATHGDVIPSRLTGYTAAMAPALSGGSFTDLDGTQLQAACAFMLREI